MATTSNENNRLLRSSELALLENKSATLVPQQLIPEAKLLSESSVHDLSKAGVRLQVGELPIPLDKKLDEKKLNQVIPGTEYADQPRKLSRPERQQGVTTTELKVQNVEGTQVPLAENIVADISALSPQNQVGILNRRLSIDEDSPAMNEALSANKDFQLLENLALQRVELEEKVKNFGDNAKSLQEISEAQIAFEEETKSVSESLGEKQFDKSVMARWQKSLKLKAELAKKEEMARVVQEKLEQTNKQIKEVQKKHSKLMASTEDVFGALDETTIAQALDNGVNKKRSVRKTKIQKTDPVEEEIETFETGDWESLVTEIHKLLKNQKLDHATWQECQKRLVEVVGGVVNGESLSLEELTKKIDPDQTELWQPLILAAQQALENFKPEKDAYSSQSLALWTKKERRELTVGEYGSVDVALISTTSNELQATDDEALDAYFRAFDALSFDQRRSLAQHYVIEKNGDQDRYLHRSRGKNLALGQIQARSIWGLDCPETLEGKGVVWFELPELLSKKKLPARQDVDWWQAMEGSNSWGASTREQWLEAITSVDAVLAQKLQPILGKPFTSNDDVMKRLQTITVEDRQKCAQYVRAGSLISKISNKLESGFSGTSRQLSDQIKLDELVDDQSGHITIKVKGGISPLLITRMKSDQITPLGSPEEPFSLTISPDSRIVITGPNANGKTETAKMLMSWLMGYPKLGDIEVTGDIKAWEKITEGIWPHFQNPEVPGLSMFQRTAYGLRADLQHQFAGMDESVNGTTGEYTSDIQARVLALQPGIHVIHAAEETLQKAMSMSPGLEVNLVPIMMDKFNPQQGEVAITSGGVALAAAMLPPPELLSLLEASGRLEKLPKLSVLRKASRELSNHPELWEEAGNNTEMMEELGFGSSEGQIGWLKRILTLDALHLSGISNEELEILGSLTTDQEEMLILDKAMNSSDQEKARRTAITDWFMRVQGRDIPEVLTQLIEAFPDENIQRKARQFIQGPDNAIAPYRVSSHMSVITQLASGSHEQLAVQLLSKGEWLTTPSSESIAALSVLVPEHAKLITTMPSLISSFEKLGKSQTSDLSPELNPLVQAEVATERHRINKAWKQHLTTDARDTLVWYEKHEDEWARLDEQVENLGKSQVDQMLKLILGETSLEQVPAEMKKSLATILGWKAKWGIEVNAIDTLNKITKKEEKSSDTEVHEAWSKLYSLIQLGGGSTWIPSSIEANSSEWLNSWKLGEKEKKEVGKKLWWAMSFVLPSAFKRIDAPNEFRDQAHNLVSGLTYGSLAGEWEKVKADRMRFQTRKQSAEQIQNIGLLFDSVETTSIPESGSNWQTWFGADYVGDLQLLQRLANENQWSKLASAVLGTDKNEVTIGEIARSTEHFRGSHLARQLVTRVLAKHTSRMLTEKIPDDQVTQLERFNSALVELVSISEYARLMKTLTNAKGGEGETLSVEGITNLRVLSEWMSEEHSTGKLGLGQVEDSLRRMNNKYIQSGNLEFQAGKTSFVTGQNGIGKSTLVQGLGQVVVTNQLLGRATLDKGGVPNYERVYWVSGGESGQGMSRFTNSMQKLLQVVWMAHNNPNKKTLILMDEIGVGTNPRERQIIVESVHQVMSEYPNLTVVVVDQESHAYSHLAQLNKPTQIIEVDNSRNTKQASKFSDPDSLRVLVEDSHNGLAMPTMPPLVKRAFVKLTS